jgi:Uncharacterized protein conserved in bacteria
VDTRQLEMPGELLEALGEREDGNAPLPREAVRWLDRELGVSIGRRPAEWSADEVYLSMPGPGADAWLSIDRETGAVEYESTRRGWVSYFNDLHKGATQDRPGAGSWTSSPWPAWCSASPACSCCTCMRGSAA